MISHQLGAGHMCWWPSCPFIIFKGGLDWPYESLHFSSPFRACRLDPSSACISDSPRYAALLWCRRREPLPPWWCHWSRRDHTSYPYIIFYHAERKNSARQLVGVWGHVSGIASGSEKNKGQLLFLRPNVNTTGRHISIRSLGRVSPLTTTHD